MAVAKSAPLAPAAFVNNTNTIRIPWTHWFIYGDTGCLDGDTFIQYAKSENALVHNPVGATLRALYERFQRDPGDYFTWSITPGVHDFVANRVCGVVKTGVKPCLEVVTSWGRLVATADHKFATNDPSFLSEDAEEATFVALRDLKPGHTVVSDADGETTILEINPVGDRETYDIQMLAPYNNFVAAGFVVHNSGKTTIASTFPRPLFLVPKNESSMLTLSGRNYPYILITDKSSPFRPRNPNDPNDYSEGGMDSVLTVLENQLDASIRQNKPELFPFDTLAVEALTHYCDLVQDELTEGSTLNMDQPRWGKLASHLRNVHTRLRNMDLHVVFTALANTSKDSKEGGPAIPGSMAEKLPSACDVIGYVEVTDMGRDKPQRHTLHLRQRKQFFARTRFPNLPAQIENFNFTKIQHLLVNRVEEEKPEEETNETQGE